MFNFIFRPPSKICRNIFLGKFNCFDYSVAETSDFWLGAQFSYDKRNNSPLIVFFLNRRFDINNLVRFYADACLRFYNSFYTLFNRLTISNQIMTKIKKTIRIFFNTWWRFVSGDTLSPQRNIFSIPLQNYLKSNMCPATYLIFQWLTKISFFVFPNVSEVHKLFEVSPFWCLYCTKLVPFSKTNDSGKAPRTGEYASNLDDACLPGVIVFPAKTHLDVAYDRIGPVFSELIGRKLHVLHDCSFRLRGLAGVPEPACLGLKDAGTSRIKHSRN